VDARNCGACSALSYKTFLSIALFIINALSIVLLILASVALALALAGRYAGNITADAAIELDTVLRPPLILALAESIQNNEPIDLTKNQVCGALANMTEAIRETDVNYVMKVCQVSSFSIGLVVKLINLPPFEACLDVDEYVLDCGRLADLFREGRARCDDTTAAAAGVSIQERDDAAEAGSIAAFVSAFFQIYKDMIRINLRVKVVALRVEGTFDVLVLPFGLLIIGAIIVVVSAHFSYFAFSRYLLIELVHKLKKEAVLKNSSGNAPTYHANKPTIARA
jgi:hypothetical protein